MPKTYSLYAAKWHLSLANTSHSQPASHLSLSLSVSVSVSVSLLLSFSFSVANTKVSKSQKGKPITAITTYGNYKRTYKRNRHVPPLFGHPSGPTLALHAQEQQSLISWTPQNEWRRTQEARPIRSHRERERGRARAWLALKAEPSSTPLPPRRCSYIWDMDMDGWQW